MEKSIYIYSLSSVRDFFPKFFCFEAVENSLHITLFPLILNSVFTYLKKKRFKNMFGYIFIFNVCKTCLQRAIAYLMNCVRLCNFETNFKLFKRQILHNWARENIYFYSFNLYFWIRSSLLPNVL